ncbi:PREDICTED: WD repeat-containing protein 78 [Papilio polytes]|uniref:WD repeat-containing protein 78 n=1 Tax=Papilio polytes TaxID=76194 RepID=UPI000675FCAB|nr:PREDICTED: WD repeat-containing protein 78 [Papilio polytes]
MSVNEMSVTQEQSQKTVPSDQKLSQSESSQTTLYKMSKGTISLMEKRQMYRVIDDGMDATPDNIVDPEYVLMEDTHTHAAFGGRSDKVIKSDIGIKATKSKSKTTVEVAMKVYTTTISLDDIYIDHTKDTGESFTTEEIDLEIAPSAFYMPIQKPVMEYPEEIFVVLKETDTEFLFELPSFSYERGTIEANTVEEQNNYYQYITVGKGRNRKMVTEETQTKECVSQSRHTVATRPKKKNAISFASLWDMHDTYAQLAKIARQEETDEMVMYQSVEPRLLRKKKKIPGEATELKGISYKDICNTPAFLDAVLLTERVLATMQFANAQKKFRGLVQFNPLALDLQYVYTLKPLWTLECNETAGRPITGISFNPRNSNIVAVAHGKFTYAETFNGLISIWCTKNPCVPERLYRFDQPVTAVAFSEKNPNWLACGYHNGDVLILDITSYSIKTVAKSKRDTNPCFEPIWHINWHFIDSIQFVITTCQDGRINRFRSTKTHDFICSPIMRMATVEGQLKGLETAKVCVNVDVPIIRHPAVLCMKWHSEIDHIYFVGTDEGCIYKCSTHYSNQHIEVIRAHAGPVFNMTFSPFMERLLVTCGADNAIRLWLEELDDVIMTLNCPAAVYDVAFCPVNSTVLISVSGNVLSIWDLRRKNHIPCAEYKFPGNVVLNFVKFSKSGDNVFVGDTLGRVHTFHLEDTPIPPFYQHKILDETIKKALCTRPQLLKQLQKIEKYKDRHYK